VTTKRLVPQLLAFVVVAVPQVREPVRVLAQEPERVVEQVVEPLLLVEQVF
jgi:hypothetical protein